MNTDEEFDDDPEEPDWPDENDEETATIRCSACGADVYEDAVSCPVCGEFLERGSRNVLDGKPWWYMLLVGLGVLAVIWACLKP